MQLHLSIASGNMLQVQSMKEFYLARDGLICHGTCPLEHHPQDEVRLVPSLTSFRKSLKA